jgi:hypothetical protein
MRYNAVCLHTVIAKTHSTSTVMQKQKPLSLKAVARKGFTHSVSSSHTGRRYTYERYVTRYLSKQLHQFRVDAHVPTQSLK